MGDAIHKGTTLQTKGLPVIFFVGWAPTAVSSRQSTDVLTLTFRGRPTNMGKGCELNFSHISINGNVCININISSSAWRIALRSKDSRRQLGRGVLSLTEGCRLRTAAGAVAAPP
eukprot:scaffold17337_cov98-Isochrysis_galbana.AAC.4